MSTQAATLLRGRTIALVGIVLVALSLRTAIAAVSPIVANIDVDISIDGIRLGIIGMLPPVCFAVCGVIAPFGTRVLGIEAMTLASIVTIVIGHIMRAVAGDFSWFLAGSILAFAGTGWGNALLPPLVKRYFPDRIGTLTSLYVAALSVSAFIPPLVSVPIAGSPAGWRVALGLWGVCAAVAAVPWLITLLRRRGADRPPGPETVAASNAGVAGALWRSPTAWAILIVFASSSMTMYAMFAWLPSLLIGAAGVTPLAAGALLALYAAVGFPASVIVPGIIARTRSATAPVLIGALSVTAGILGLVIVPATAPWLWVILVSVGRMLFPVAMTLINVRTVSYSESARLSGFVNGVGYTIGVFGPLLFGVFHDATGGWETPLLFLLIPAAAAIIAVVPLARRAMVFTSHP